MVINTTKYLMASSKFPNKQSIYENSNLKKRSFAIRSSRHRARHSNKNSSLKHSIAWKSRNNNLFHDAIYMHLKYCTKKTTHFIKTHMNEIIHGTHIRQNRCPKIRIKGNKQRKGGNGQDDVNSRLKLGNIINSTSTTEIQEKEKNFFRISA